MLYAEECWVGATIIKALQRDADPEHGKRLAESARTAGWRVSRVESVRAALEELSSPPGKTAIFLLDEEAPLDTEAQLERAREEQVQQIVFILGDHLGFGPALRNSFVAHFGARLSHLGTVPLLTSQCITIINHLVDGVHNSA